MSVKFEQIPLFYTRGWAAPPQGIAPIAILEFIARHCRVVRADYIRPRPRARPRGHRELLKLLRLRAERTILLGHRGQMPRPSMCAGTTAGPGGSPPVLGSVSRRPGPAAESGLNLNLNKA